MVHLYILESCIDIHLQSEIMDVSYYFSDLFLNYDNERWQFE